MATPRSPAHDFFGESPARATAPDQTAEGAIGVAILRELRQLGGVVNDMTGRVTALEGRRVATTVESLRRAPPIVPAAAMGTTGATEAEAAVLRELLGAPDSMPSTELPLPGAGAATVAAGPATGGAGSGAPAQGPDVVRILQQVVETQAATIASMVSEPVPMTDGSTAGLGRGGERAYLRLQADFERDPEREIAEYLGTIRQELQATDPGQVWSIEEYGKTRVPFKGHNTLLRMFQMLAKIAHYHRSGQPRHAYGMTLLCLQAVERATRDDGVWAAAWPITYLPDPFEGRAATSQEKMNTIGRLLTERRTLEETIEKHKSRGPQGGRRGGDRE